jgi:hypothetical protein
MLRLGKSGICGNGINCEIEVLPASAPTFFGQGTALF